MAECSRIFNFDQSSDKPIKRCLFVELINWWNLLHLSMYCINKRILIIKRDPKIFGISKSFVIPCKEKANVRLHISCCRCCCCSKFVFCNIAWTQFSDALLHAKLYYWVEAALLLLMIYYCCEQTPSSIVIMMSIVGPTMDFTAR